MDGYKEAFILDQQINALAQKNTPSVDNALEWLHFTRTVKSSLDILEAVALEYALLEDSE